MINVPERENQSVFNPDQVVEDLRTGERGSFVGFETRGNTRFARFKFPTYAATLPEALVPTRIAQAQIDKDVDPARFIDHGVDAEEGKTPGAIRARIIDDIAVFNGLRPASYLTKGARQHFTSTDLDEDDDVYSVILTPGMDELEIRDEILSKGSETIFHVLGERNDDPDTEAMEKDEEKWDRIINERHDSSFLVVVSLDKLLERTKRNMRYGYHPVVVSLNPPEEMDAPIVKVADAILPSELSHLIFPAPILEEYQRLSQNFANIKAKISSVGQTYDEEDSWRIYDPHGDVPDYLGVLYDLSQEITIPHLVHGVRLPLDSELIPDDIALDEN